MTSIPHNAIILVADGRKALFLRNEGDEKFPNFKVDDVAVDYNPSSHEQGTDRPGHFAKQAAGGRRTSAEPTDWHELEEQKFARAAAKALTNVFHARHPSALVIAAPPRTLAVLRDALGEDVTRKIILELDKDLTKTPTFEIERHIVG